MDSPAVAQPVMCKVCGTYFETRRGLSSHARLHLRQLGVTLSETSGAPIELLYQLIKERDGSLPDLKADSYVTGLNPTGDQQESSLVSEDEDPSPKAGDRVIISPQKLDPQGSPVRLKESTLLPLSPSALRMAESRLSEGTSSSLDTLTKPLWAPLETDAPITLDTSDEVHVCQLCGCWYETRKGLASHARVHLRQIGIADSEVKGSPIEYLYQIMEDEDVKPISSEQEPITCDSPPRPSSKRPADLSPPPVSPSPSKRPKGQVEFTCILCGEMFENRKGLAIHARYHLRHIGVNDLLGKSSAIETVQELVNRGMLKGLHPLKTKSKANSSAVQSPAPASLLPLPLSAAPGQSQTFSPKPPQSPHRAPKAKKGFRLAVDPLLRKPKPELVETEVSVPVSGSCTTSSSPTQKPTGPAVVSKPLNADVQSPPTVLCDFCGQLFDTRKALSCHVRSHLRQLGLTWSIKTSPIDLLREVMMQGEEGMKVPSGASVSGKATGTPQGSRRSVDSVLSGEPSSKPSTSPLDYSMKDKSSPAKTGTSPIDTSCELCGFDFENRKALASHARAHLRQLGLYEWKAEGATSPIELLSELIRKDPARVSEITQRFRIYIKKAQRTSSPSLSTDSDSVPGSSLKLVGQQSEHRFRREDPGAATSSMRQSQGHTRPVAAQRGVHQKHVVSTGEESSSQQTPRSGSIPAMLPKPPLTPLVKLVGKIYSLKCRFCDEVFHGPLSVQEQWITHLQKHILTLGYKGKASPPTPPVASPALVHPVAV